MATSEEAPKVVPQEDSTATVTIATETEKPGKLDLTNSGQITNNTVAPGDDLVMNGSVTGENESTVSPGNDPATTPENGAGLVVTVCGTTEAGEEVCVTVGRERGEGRERSGSLPNGKLSSTGELPFPTTMSDDSVIVIQRFQDNTGTIVPFHPLAPEDCLLMAPRVCLYLIRLLICSSIFLSSSLPPHTHTRIECSFSLFLLRSFIAI